MTSGALYHYGRLFINWTFEYVQIDVRLIYILFEGITLPPHCKRTGRTFVKHATGCILPSF